MKLKHVLWLQRDFYCVEGGKMALLLVKVADPCSKVYFGFTQFLHLSYFVNFDMFYMYDSFLGNTVSQFVCLPSTKANSQKHPL